MSKEWALLIVTQVAECVGHTILAASKGIIDHIEIMQSSEELCVYPVEGEAGAYLWRGTVDAALEGSGESPVLVPWSEVAGWLARNGEVAQAQGEPGAREAVSAFLAKASSWAIHPSHLAPMRNAVSDEEARLAVRAFLAKVDAGMVVNEAHLAGLRAFVREE